MKDYNTLQNILRENPKTWFVTGVAGFIGSHLAQELIALGQPVTGVDDFSTGRKTNLGNFNNSGLFQFFEGDIRDKGFCSRVCEKADYVLHHAAIGSVVKSLEDPAFVDSVNNGGFRNILDAAAESGVKRVIYASSSAVYGDGTDRPRHERERRLPLSPYAETKCANEDYAKKMSSSVSSVGLRYFNIYGPRQDPNGTYAAVIPKWINEMLAGTQVEIYGDGQTIRDFCFVGDAVQANMRAALMEIPQGECPVYNIASGQGVSLNELFATLKMLSSYGQEAVYRNFREADIKISSADISRAEKELGFMPSVSLPDGLEKAILWYRDNYNG